MVGLSAASHNPFDRALPFMSQKCMPSVKETQRCELQSCDVGDFVPELGHFEGAPSFGKLGRYKDGGLYNCVSSSGDVTDALLLQGKILDPNLSNTAMKRSEVFHALDVKTSADSLITRRSPSAITSIDPSRSSLKETTPIRVNGSIRFFAQRLHHRFHHDLAH